jgi:hypothetical protein
MIPSPFLDVISSFLCEMFCYVQTEASKAAKRPNENIQLAKQNVFIKKLASKSESIIWIRSVKKMPDFFLKKKSEN